MKQGWRKRKNRDETSSTRDLSCYSCSRTSLAENDFSKNQLKKISGKQLLKSEMKCLYCTRKIENQPLNKTNMKDPSMRYIKKPTNTPLMKECNTYFSNVLKNVFQIHIGPLEGWRTIAKLAVRRNINKTVQSTAITTYPLIIGLFEPGSHKVIENTGHSSAHHHAINEVVTMVEQASCQVPITAYDESSGEGLLRYLLFGVQRDTSTVQLTLVLNMSSETYHHNSNSNKSVNDFLNTLRSSSRVNIFHSIWLHFHQASKHNNAICGRDNDSWQLVYGSRAIEETLDVGITNGYKVPILRFPPMVFRQANLDSFINIIKTIRCWILPNSRCVELYGGVGTIGLNCLDLLSSLNCSDENPYNKECFEWTLAGLSPEITCQVKYISSPAATMAISGALDDCDLILVDPPRKGLDDEVVTALLSLRENKSNKRRKLGKHKRNFDEEVDERTSTTAKLPVRLVYVSCGFKSFMRDANRLLQFNESSASDWRWRLLHAEGHVLFPGADHIETLSVFELQSSV